MNISADALFGWPVIWKPMEFENSFWNSATVNSFCTYVARSVFQDDHSLLFQQRINCNITTFLLNVCNFTSCIYLSHNVCCTHNTKIYATNIYFLIPPFVILHIRDWNLVQICAHFLSADILLYHDSSIVVGHAVPDDIYRRFDRKDLLEWY